MSAWELVRSIHAHFLAREVHSSQKEDWAAEGTDPGMVFSILALWKGWVLPCLRLATTVSCRRRWQRGSCGYFCSQSSLRGPALEEGREQTPGYFGHYNYCSQLLQYSIQSNSGCFSFYSGFGFVWISWSSTSLSQKISLESGYHIAVFVKPVLSLPPNI